MRYWPASFVVAVLTFSISTGLLASTVTPGRTAPVVSFTTPAIALCACAARGRIRQTTTRTRPRRNAQQDMKALLDLELHSHAEAEQPRRQNRVDAIEGRPE